MKLGAFLFRMTKVALIVLTVILMCWSGALLSQSVPTQEAAKAENDKLVNEIWAASESGGEESLRAWMKANKERVSAELIISLVQNGVRERSEGLLGVARLCAEEKGDKKCLADVYTQVGNYHSYVGNNSQAMSFYDLALPLYMVLGDLPGQGAVYCSEGDIFSTTGENAKALAVYEKALPLFEKAQNPLGQGIVYLMEGDIYLYTGENRKALAMYEKALPLFEKAQSPLGQANVYWSEGNISLKTGENAKALAMYEKALPLYEKAQDPVGQANVYLREGGIYLQTRENAKAFAMCEKALPLYEKAQDPLGQGNVYGSEADIYCYTGENAKALAMYEKALPLFEKAQDPGGQGSVYRREGNVFLETSENAKALAMYEKALPLYEKAQDPVGQGNVYQSEGDILFTTGENGKALAMYEKALSFSEKAQDPLGQGNVYRSEGDIYLYTGEDAKALAMYEKALVLYKKADDIESQAFALRGKGRALAGMQKNNEAAVLFEESLALLERVRTQTGFSEMKKGFMEKVYGDYLYAALFMLDNQQPERSFRIAECMKARVFLDSLAEGLVKLDEGLTLDLREKRNGLVGRFSALNKQLQEDAGKGDEAKLKALREEIKGVEADLETVYLEIRLKNPKYAEVRYPEPVSVQDLRQKTLKPGEVLVEYLLAEKEAWVFAVTQDKFQAVRLSATPQQIRDAVRTFLGVASVPGGWASGAVPLSGGAKTGQAPLETSAALYAMLVTPIQGQIPEGATIIVVPDGELAFLPFEALVASYDEDSGKAAYLLEKHPVKYVQSATVLALLRAQSGKEQPSTAFLGFGDPIYDYEDYKAGNPERGEAKREGGGFTAEVHRDAYSREGGNLARLEGTGAEVRAVAGLFEKGSRPQRAELRESAREEKAKASDVKGYGYVHFACHGLLGSGFQGLALSQIPGSAEDGYLTLGEIMGLNWNARMVVLSACQTGKGKLEKGEGVTGLTRAVMYAGSPAAVVSLWSVDDVGTKELMVRFYSNLLEKNLDGPSALRQAKLEMLKEGKRDAPYFWAPFVMFGE